MDQSIISRDMIEAKARAAFRRGVGREEHNFNWHSTEAIAVWQAEWDRCAAEAWGFSLEEPVAEVSPP
jgi:hypothetical protein